MCTFIIYCRNNQNINETVQDLIDKTPPTLMKQIIICDENGVINQEELPLNKWDLVIKTNNVGKSKAYNHAADLATEDILVFLQQPTKFSPDWLEPLVGFLEEKTLASPVSHILDTNLWSLEDRGWQRYGLRWDFTMYNRKFTSGNPSPIAAFCMVIHTKFFRQIGGFDDESGPGPGDNICLSLKTWLAGGEIKVSDDSHIGIVPELEAGHSDNIVRLVEAWFSDYSTYYYNMSGQHRRDTGRIDKLVRFAEECEKDGRSIKWWLETLQPELLETYALHGTAHGKRIAVVGDGPSLDYVNWAWINSHDIVIAVDFLGLQLDYDYLVSNSLDVVQQLKSTDKLIVPYMLEGKDKLMASEDAAPGAIQVELGDVGAVGSVFPPFCNFGSATLLALHFALFLGPQSITLFGCDNKILEGKSHTSLIKQYNGGQIWPESEQTSKRLNFYEFGVDRLGKLALQLGIPLIRIGHA